MLLPTSPNSIETFPFDDEDPFILHELPTIFIVANAPKFYIDYLMFDNDVKATMIVFLTNFGTLGEAA